MYKDIFMLTSNDTKLLNSGLDTDKCTNLRPVVYTVHCNYWMVISAILKPSAAKQQHLCFISNTLVWKILRDWKVTNYHWIKSKKNDSKNKILINSESWRVSLQASHQNIFQLNPVKYYIEANHSTQVASTKNC